jgi:Protein of unknown function (DUF3467)
MEKERDKTVAIPGSSEARPNVEVKRDEEEFFSTYANSVIVESNVFDMKLIFGLLDQRDPLHAIINQFLSVNISWVEVKLLLYWMQVHLASHELENGKVRVPPKAFPTEIPAEPPPPFDSPLGREAFEVLRKMRAEFVAKESEP